MTLSSDWKLNSYTAQIFILRSKSSSHKIQPSARDQIQGPTSRQKGRKSLSLFALPYRLRVTLITSSLPQAWTAGRIFSVFLFPFYSHYCLGDGFQEIQIQWVGYFILTARRPRFAQCRALCHFQCLCLHLRLLVAWGWTLCLPLPTLHRLLRPMTKKCKPSRDIFVCSNSRMRTC